MVSYVMISEVKKFLESNILQNLFENKINQSKSSTFLCVRQIDDFFTIGDTVAPRSSIPISFFRPGATDQQQEILETYTNQKVYFFFQYHRFVLANYRVK